MMMRMVCSAPLAFALAGCFGVDGSPRPGFAAPPPPEPPITVASYQRLSAESIAAQPIAARGKEANAGAIFQSSNGYAGLVTGTRARSLGDMVTIVLVENTSTTKSTTGQTDRSGSLGLIPPTSGPLGFLNPNALNASGEGSFNGGGNAGQQSQLSGTVAVTISAIYPNGTAEVVGEKHMAFSQGKEWVQFAGRIRLVDIDADNRLPSSRVANARMIYSGNGAVQQASRPGWLSQFFNLISPF